MSKDNLTASQLREVLQYDQQTGEFLRRVNSRRRPNTLIRAGVKTSQGYISIYVAGHEYTAHRLAWLYVYEVWPIGDIDHINGNRQDNRIENLRDVPRVVNSQNRRSARTKKTSGLPLGVSMKNAALAKPYFAVIRSNRKQVHLGYFSDADSAHEAYIAAKRKMHEGCTI